MTKLSEAMARLDQHTHLTPYAADLELIENHIASVTIMLRAIVDHWDEFGPEHGLDEVIDRARNVANAFVEHDLKAGQSEHGTRTGEK